MLIGELARRTGVSTRALRHYEENGVLRSFRDANGYRRYPEQAVVRVRNIRHLLEAGMILEDIEPMGDCLDQDLRGQAACHAALEVAERRLAELERRWAALGALRDNLRSRVESLRGEIHRRHEVA
ncbi:MerR family transcriptional regulator [Streptoalloteichus hindustanus]|uniref:Transcriptional regulator, MerR family n=1 Tax=Streptoalloteichus hindustanus TaxID=2017 RepID=A0A1M5NTE2_STRHI|nr:MerR family transcriptional regulator [Streptoalloteichus hindustanus]SHG92223.1 transcriptional regulator, MerR family [Streptoalloteichus hindustanus]